MQPIWGPIAAFVAKPHLWISITFLLVMAARCAKRGVLPTERQVIEYLAYAAGLYGSTTLFQIAVHPPDTLPDSGWSLMAGGTVLGLASARGAWSVLQGIRVEDDAWDAEYDPELHSDITIEGEPGLASVPAPAADGKPGATA